MFTVKDQFGYMVAVCNNYDNAVKAANRFTSKDIYVGKSASIFDVNNVEIFRTTVSAIED
jgi:hypothetical protein|nr:MAG TPA: hypothetical protein [Caudoviricetes sp.]